MQSNGEDGTTKKLIMQDRVVSPDFGKHTSKPCDAMLKDDIASIRLDVTE